MGDSMENLHFSGVFHLNKHAQFRKTNKFENKLTNWTLVLIENKGCCIYIYGQINVTGI